MTEREELLLEMKDLRERVTALEGAKIEDDLSIEELRKRNTVAMRSLWIFRRALRRSGLMELRSSARAELDSSPAGVKRALGLRPGNGGPA